VETIKVGDGLKLKVHTDIQDTLYNAIILDVLDEQVFAISGPMKEGKNVYVRMNSEVELSFMDPKKGKFYFKAIVIDTQLSPVYTIVVKQIESLKRIQIRNYYRLRERNQIVKRHKKKIDMKIKTIEEISVTDDISGGGTSVLSNYEHYNGDIIELVLPFIYQRKMIAGKVVRVLDSPLRIFKYKICLEFTEIDERDQEDLITYIFKRQRELRKNEEIL
jgi:c-di-GMP-binding flagellar brake protein YcgR